MRKPSHAAKHWIPVTTADGRKGRYEVSDGWLTVESNGRTKRTAKSTSGDDLVLAGVMLSTADWGSLANVEERND